MRQLFIAMVFSCLAGALFAQQTSNGASLVADQVTFDAANQRLAADGNVEILQDGVRLRASSIVYDGQTDRLEVGGPLYLIDGSDITIIADFAELSGDLQSGVLGQARAVFTQQLQIAANEIRRSEGRYTQFYKTVASSCQICADNPVPLWEIRAQTITHDQKERQLYFDNASFRVLDIPIFYWPYLRLPDPTVERATGFLLPSLQSNGDIGVGLKFPYFITLGDHADLTLTPWVTTRGSNTLEARYRRKFRFGEIELNGAVTDDDLTLSNNPRSYLFADGRFALPHDFDLTFDIELVSDPGYLLLYGYSDKDRLDSALAVSRTRADEYIGFELIHYKSLREGDDNRVLPTLVGDAVYTKRFAPALTGGIATLQFEASGFNRRSDLATDGIGRDAIRLSGLAEWRRDWVLSNGMVLAGATSLRADFYNIAQDARPEFGDTVEVTPYAATEWRWPMRRQDSGATHLIEPTVQLVWSSENTRNVANEDSLLVEFDEANLFSYSRFSGVDAQESGMRLNMGVSYTREDVDGWSLGLTVGRVLRETDLGQFTVSSGLQGRDSDWLAAAQLKVGDAFTLTNRALFEDDFSFSRNEMRLAWSAEDYSLGSTYVWLEADPDEGRPLDISEFTIDGDYRFNRHWTLSSDLRYDFVEDRTSRAGIGVSYQNECARFDLSLSRRFTSSINVTPTTDVSLSVQLAGFGATRTGGAGFARSCSG